MRTYDGLRTEREGFDNIGAGANPRVEEDCELPRGLSLLDDRRAHDAREGVKRWDGAVHLAATCSASTSQRSVASQRVLGARRDIP